MPSFTPSVRFMTLDSIVFIANIHRMSHKGKTIFANSKGVVVQHFTEVHPFKRGLIRLITVGTRLIKEVALPWNTAH